MGEVRRLNWALLGAIGMSLCFWAGILVLAIVM
jgi:hypothetical protein